MTNFYIDMDGVIANFHKEKFNFKNASNRTWIANLEPFTENVNIIKSLISMGNKVYILSKAINEQARLGKIDWLAKYLPEIDIEDIIVIVGNGKKVDYMRTETGTLIDDDIKNTRPWIKAGHKAILLENKGEKIKL